MPAASLTDMRNHLIDAGDTMARAAQATAKAQAMAATDASGDPASAALAAMAGSYASAARDLAAAVASLQGVT